MLGNGKNESVDIGPLINENALEKVEQIVADAVRKGAVIACGGRALGKLRALVLPDRVT